MTRPDPEVGGAWREQQIEAAVREVERYFLAHPNASDTLQGVCDWWLPALDRPLRADIVQEGLDRLVMRRVLEARPIPGGVVYARARQRNE